VDAKDIDIDEVTSAEFLRITRSAPDAEVQRVIRELGTEAVLDRVFDGFASQLVPARAPSSRTVVQWEVKDEGRSHLRALVIDGGQCVVEPGEQRADVRLSADLVTFVRLLEGTASPTMMLLKRRLGLKGSKALALSLDALFARPT
jgi:predicted lipid carrier protein YhbT